MSAVIAKGGEQVYKGGEQVYKGGEQVYKEEYQNRLCYNNYIIISKVFNQNKV